MFEYMYSKYSDLSIQGLVNLCTLLDPRFKFDYIKNYRQHDSTVTLIKSTVQQQVLDLITKESQESEASHDDLQK